MQHHIPVPHRVAVIWVIKKVIYIVNCKFEKQKWLSLACADDILFSRSPVEAVACLMLLFNPKMGNVKIPFIFVHEPF